jgi:hypothetical protein
MAWVRYDDQFHNNAKVTGVVVEDAGAIGLHTLANTWTNTQKHKGFVPVHQPGALICDKVRGPQWADLLVKYGLWHRVDDLCPACEEEYADLPEGLDGFVFHNAREYRPPERDRVTPGTSAELSEKRRAAGRKGGQASAKKRDELKQRQAKQAGAQASQANGKHIEAPASAPSDPAQDGPYGAAAGDDVETRPAETSTVEQASQANGVSKATNLLGRGVSPVPVPESSDASYEASAQPPSEAAADKPRHTQATLDGTVEPPSPLTITQRSKRITDAYAAAEPMCKWPAVNNVVIKAIKAERWTDDVILAAVLRLAETKRSVTVDALRFELDPPDNVRPFPDKRYAPGSGSQVPPRDSYTKEDYI